MGTLDAGGGRRDHLPVGACGGGAVGTHEGALVAIAITKPITHTLLFGFFGCGKSTGARTWPTPQLIFMFDPVGNEYPYLYGGDGQPYGVIAPSVDALGTPIQESYASDGTVLVRVEHYIDRDPKVPTAWERFLVRKSSLDPTQWATITTDSLTWAELAARKQQQYVLNKTARDPRQWFGGSTDTIEEAIMMSFGSYATNVVVVAHVDKDRSDSGGGSVRHPMAPGRLLGGLPSGFGEVYHAFTRRDDTGNVQYLWQTRGDNEFAAKSIIRAPDPCPQHYLAMWAR